MTHILVQRIYDIALVAALCAAFMSVALLFNQAFESVAPAEEILSGWRGCCELPPVW
jgi:hypothetical protein